MNSELIQQIKNWYSDNKTRKISSNIFWALILVGVLVFFFFRGRKQQTEQAAEKLSEGLKVFYCMSREESMGMQQGPFSYQTKEERLDAAEERFDEVLEYYQKSSSYAIAMFYKGTILFEEKDYDGAIEYFIKITEEFPEHNLYDQSLLKLGYAYDAAGDCEKSIQILDRLTDEFPGTRIACYAYYHKSFCHEKLREFDKAKESLKKIIDEETDVSFIEEVENRLKFLEFTKESE